MTLIFIILIYIANYIANYSIAHVADKAPTCGELIDILKKNLWIVALWQRFYVQKVKEVYPAIRIV